jgi:NADPH-dependent 2,4-dienoyl-CoA reductase/sulfur reductase-like enzyme
MTEQRELVVIGAGPAGMACALRASAHGVDVVVIDEGTAPGGQIYRAVERPGIAASQALGDDYVQGASLVAEFRGGAFEYRPATTVWAVDEQRRVRLSGGEGSRAIRAQRVVIATGALERPFPIPGWTLPGVLSAGGAQSVLKSAGLVPSGPVVLAGAGPLLLLLLRQYLALGVPVAAVLETVTFRDRLRAVPHLPAALASGRELARGCALLSTLARSGVRHLRGVRDLRALGEERLERVDFVHGSRREEIETSMLLLHQGVVPELGLVRALGCELEWDLRALCFRPKLDAWGNSSIEGVAIAGDGGGIVGAHAARCAGELAGLEAAHALGRIRREERDRAGQGVGDRRRRYLRIRPLIEALYRPGDAYRVPESDEVVVCRCEEVRAGTVRREAARGNLDPNAVKSRTRCGMGPCQGRYCGLTLTELLAASSGLAPQHVGYLRLRPPVKPIPLGDILALDAGRVPDEVRLPDPLATQGDGQ